MTGTKSKLCQILNSWLSVLLTAFFVLCEVQLNVWCSQQVDFSIFILSDGLLVLTVFVHHNVGLFCFFFFFNCQKCLTTIFRCGLCLITLVMEDQWNWISGAEVYTGSWIYWYTEKKKKKDTFTLWTRWRYWICSNKNLHELQILFCFFFLVHGRSLLIFQITRCVCPLWNTGLSV